MNPLAPDRYCCIGRHPERAMSTAHAGSSPVPPYPQALESYRPTETALHKAQHRRLSGAKAQSQKAETGAETLGLLLARPAFSRAETALANRFGRNTRHPCSSPVLLRSQSVPKPAPRLALRCSGHSVLSHSLPSDSPNATDGELSGSGRLATSTRMQRVPLAALPRTAATPTLAGRVKVFFRWLPGNWKRSGTSRSPGITAFPGASSQRSIVTYIGLQAIWMPSVRKMSCKKSMIKPAWDSGKERKICKAKTCGPAHLTARISSRTKMNSMIDAKICFNYTISSTGSRKRRQSF